MRPYWHPAERDIDLACLEYLIDIAPVIGGADRSVSILPARAASASAIPEASTVLARGDGAVGANGRYPPGMRGVL